MISILNTRFLFLALASLAHKYIYFYNIAILQLGFTYIKNDCGHRICVLPPNN